MKADPPHDDAWDPQLAVRVDELTADLARRAGMTAPSVRIVARIGPRPSAARRRNGALGQLGLTMVLPRRAPVITLASSGVAAADDRVLEHLIAHELGHVAHLRAPAGRRYMAAVIAGLAGVGVALLLWMIGVLTQLATATNPWPWTVLVWPFVGLLSLALLGVRRRQEVAADAFAIDLVPDLGAAQRLFELEDGTGVLRETRAFSWVLAQHPSPRRRVQLMRQQLAT